MFPLGVLSIIKKAGGLLKRWYYPFAVSMAGFTSLKVSADSVEQLEYSSSSNLSKITFSSDGKSFCVGGSSEVTVYDTDGDSKTNPRSLSSNNSFRANAISPDGQLLVVGYSEVTKIRAFKVSAVALTELTAFNVQPYEFINSLEWSHNGKYLAVCCDSSIDIYKRTNDTLTKLTTITSRAGKPISRALGYAGSYSGVKWSHDDSYLGFHGYVYNESSLLTSSIVCVYSFNGTTVTEIGDEYSSSSLPRAKWFNKSNKLVYTTPGGNIFTNLVVASDNTVTVNPTVYNPESNINDFSFSDDDKLLLVGASSVFKSLVIYALTEPGSDVVYTPLSNDLFAGGSYLQYNPAFSVDFKPRLNYSAAIAESTGLIISSTSGVTNYEFNSGTTTGHLVRESYGNGAVAVSADGKVVSIWLSGGVSIYDRALDNSLTLRMSFYPNGGACFAMCLNHDGSKLFLRTTSSDANGIKYYLLNGTNRIEGTVTGDPLNSSETTVCELSPDEQFFITSTSNDLVVYSVSGAELSFLGSTGAAVYGARITGTKFNRSGDKVAVMISGQESAIFDFEYGTLTEVCRFGDSGSITSFGNSISWSPVGNYFVAVSSLNVAKLYSFMNKTVTELSTSNLFSDMVRADAVAFSNDGAFIAVSGTISGDSKILSLYSVSYADLPVITKLGPVEYAPGGNTGYSPYGLTFIPKQTV